MLPIVQIGPFAMQTPGLALLLGIWLGLTLAERLAPHFGANANDIYNLTFSALLAGIIGARLSYVLQFPQAFIASPLSLISLNPALLDPSGGAVIGAFAALIYGNRKKLALWSTLNALTPLLAVTAVAIGVSHFASGDSFGMQTDLPWGIELWGLKRHPSQIYEVILAVLILWAILPKKQGGPKRGPELSGRTFWYFLSLSAGARLFLEGFRGDSLTMANGMRIAQMVAWIVLAASLWMLHKQQNIEGRSS